MTLASHRFVFVTAAIALCAMWGQRTSAQPAPPTGSAPAAGAPATPPPPAAPAPNDPAEADSSIARPAPDAPPDKVKDAKDTAKAAALTPIVPHPSGATRPAFQLYAEIDLPILTVGVVFVGSRYVRTQRAFCAPLCDPQELNSLDRSTAGYWSPAWSTASDIGLAAMYVGAGVLLISDEGLLSALNDGLVIAESAMSATAAASMMTLAAGRPRPFLYGDKAPLSERNSSDAGNSFLSSHAALAFAVATSTYVTAHRLHPTSKMPYWVLGIGLGTGSFIATARVMAGKHFVTDAVGGSLVGSAVGVLISSLHRSPVTIIPVTGDHQQGLGVQGSF